MPARTFKREVAEVRNDAMKICEHLPGWDIVHESASPWYAHLKNSKGQQLTISYDDAPKRYRMWFQWPRDNDRTEQEIPGVRNSTTANFQNGPEAAALAITKRLLPVLRQHWDAAVAKAKEADSKREKKANVVERLNRLFDQTPSPHYGDTVYGKYGIWKIQVNSIDGSTAAMEIRSIPIELVEKIVAVCKAHHEKKSK